MSEDGQTVSWYTAASKTLHTYGAVLVVVTSTINRALAYFLRHLRPLIVAELPRNGKPCYDIAALGMLLACSQYREPIY